MLALRCCVIALSLVTFLSPGAGQDSAEDEKRRPCAGSKRWENDDATKPVRCCSDFRPPTKIEHAGPKYPRSDVRRSGSPILSAVIEPDGTVEDVEFLRHPVFTPPWPEAEEAIIQAIRKWRYEPTVVNGKRVPVCMTIMIHIHFW